MNFDSMHLRLHKRAPLKRMHVKCSLNTLTVLVRLKDVKVFHTELLYHSNAIGFGVVQAVYNMMYYGQTSVNP